MAVQQQYGLLGKDAARSIRLRHDHGPCFVDNEFKKQTKAWSLTPAYAFVGHPETNGVTECFFKTLKEQVVYGRTFKDIEELQPAVRDARLAPRGAQ
jgi:transposase InsO family protein